jgi:hypothetical protein
VGTPVAGDTVLLNVAALALGLGTGGHASVVALPDRLPSDVDGPGHLVKARYTPLQVVVQGADEQDAPTHALLADGAPLPPGAGRGRRPALLAAGGARGRARRPPGTRVAYAMTDGGALPAVAEPDRGGAGGPAWSGRSPSARRSAATSRR